MHARAVTATLVPRFALLSLCSAVSASLVAHPVSKLTPPLAHPLQAGLRGINLSGGQRQRLNLARAAYASPSDLVLLDNALSAVDHHTAQHIFEHCVRGLFRDKATILVTHQVGWGERPGAWGLRRALRALR